MSDTVLDVHRRALSDYRIALGLELRARRKNAEYSFEKLASCTPHPAMPRTNVMTGDDQRMTRPLTPGEALEKLFMANADQGANAANDELVAALRQRARAPISESARESPMSGRGS